MDQKPKVVPSRNMVQFRIARGYPGMLNFRGSPIQLHALQKVCFLLDCTIDYFVTEKAHLRKDAEKRLLALMHNRGYESIDQFCKETKWDRLQFYREFLTLIRRAKGYDTETKEGSL